MPRMRNELGEKAELGRAETGKVDNIRYSDMGYQVTTIDGNKFVTYWDIGKLPGMGVGAVVEYSKGLDNETVISRHPRVTLPHPFAEIIGVIDPKTKNQGGEVVARRHDMPRMQKWASGWNHPSLPGQVFGSRRELVAALPQGAMGDGKRVPDYVRAGHSHEEEVGAAIEMIRSKLEHAEKFMSAQRVAGHPMFVSLMFEEISKFSRKAEEAARLMEEEWRAQEGYAASGSGSRTRTAGQWNPSRFDRELEDRGDPEEDDFGEYLDEGDGLGDLPDDDDDEFVPGVEDMDEVDLPYGPDEVSDTDDALESLYDEIERKGLDATSLGLAKEKAMAIAMGEGMSDEQMEQVKYILRKIDWMERKING